MTSDSTAKSRSPASRYHLPIIPKKLQIVWSMPILRTIGWNLSWCFHVMSAAFAYNVQCIILSLKKLAYLKYERVLLYSNDRLVGFLTPSLSLKKDWIIVIGSEKGYSLLSYTLLSLLLENISLPGRRYTNNGKIFYQILWGCKNVKATQSCSSRSIKKNRSREKKT